MRKELQGYEKRPPEIANPNIWFRVDLRKLPRTLTNPHFNLPCISKTLIPIHSPISMLEYQSICIGCNASNSAEYRGALAPDSDDLSTKFDTEFRAPPASYTPKIELIYLAG